MEDYFDENDIIDLTDNDSEFTLDTSEEEEEEHFRELELNEKCRLEQAVYDLKFKQQNKSITNLDLEVSRYANSLKSIKWFLFKAEKIKIRVDKQLKILQELDYDYYGCGEDFEEKGKERKLQKKYFSAWGSRRPVPEAEKHEDKMKMMKKDLVAEFESFCDVEKFKLYILCGETRNYIGKLWPFSSDLVLMVKIK